MHRSHEIGRSPPPPKDKYPWAVLMVGHQYRICFMSSFWCLKFWGVSYFGKSIDPYVRLGVAFLTAAAAAILEELLHPQCCVPLHQFVILNSPTDSSFGLESRPRAGRPANVVRFPTGTEISLFATIRRLVWATQHLLWVRVFFFFAWK